MSNLTQKIRSFLRDEEGLTMTEYAVAGGLVVMGAVGMFSLLGKNISARINEIAQAVSGTAATQ
ncbi:Flp family type IVb pilin [Nitrosococcus wardiae]|uniref:Flp family type IVb pilin n=1 Tax=Nitrosococcus wardiae TaxID=1814290 RepID=A0A4P7C041_9GAMM|nr:Flp family type IVb pilin [Nitrosococcus wardiae]QBQ55883.1 Flp family type IVb pilin [Nitrosococcus wardiae]